MTKPLVSVLVNTIRLPLTILDFVLYFLFSLAADFRRPFRFLYALGF